MGLLDDAIREHLELKRKHGAPDEELERKENEALGPARRDFSAPEPEAQEAGPEAAPLPSDEAAPDYEPAPVQAEPPGWLDEDEPPAPPAAETPAPPPPEPPAPAPDPEPVARAVEPAPEPPAPAPPRDPVPEQEPRRTSDTPTQGFDALSLDDEGDEEESEDVLEETPDFLQDTPEHDRLWFEQKPPRDFDFDE